MVVPVIMPRQGQSVETCIIGEWRKKVGEAVKTGDILFSYETDKASFEEEAKVDGELLAVFYKEGDEVPVLTNVAVIGKKGEGIEEFRPGGTGATESQIPKEGSGDVVIQTITTGDESVAAIQSNEVAHVLAKESSGEVKISPCAKIMVEKHGISRENIAGSGPYGRIIARDVEAVIEKSPLMTPLAKEKAVAENLVRAKETSGLGGRIGAEDLVAVNPVYGEDFEVKKLSNIRKLIARSMYQSLHNSAQLTHHMSADARKIMALRKDFKKKYESGETSANITINDLVCSAVINALKKFPQVNTHFLGDSMRWFRKIHLGLAVDTPRGLMVPVVKNADDLSPEGLSAQLAGVAAQCRKGSIDPELLKPEAASFTVSNLGNYGVEMFTPVINLPQTAILGVCTIVPRPKDLGDGVYGFVPMLGLSLTYDHQALDGGEATLFLKEIKEQIENIMI